LEFLSNSGHSESFNPNQDQENASFREFKIRALKVNGSKDKYPCSFDIQFDKVEKEKKRGEKIDDKKEYRIGLWNAVVHERDVLNVKMLCLKELVIFKMINMFIK
jgi:hypothetical protein